MWRETKSTMSEEETKAEHSSPPATLPQASENGPQGEQYRLLRSSLLSGLCPLFPLPIVDDWLRDGLRERAVKTLLEERGFKFSPAEVRLLALGESGPASEGCVGCFVNALWWPFRFLGSFLVKKVLRKLIFVLAIKDCASELSRCYHVLHLLRHAASRNAFAVEEAQRPARLLAIRKAVEQAVDSLGITPLDPWIKLTFRRSWRLIVRSSRSMSDLLRRSPRQKEDQEPVYAELEGETRQLDSLVDELAKELAAEEHYLRTLEDAFDNALRA